jgi:hypothetical protein
MVEGFYTFLYKLLKFFITFEVSVVVQLRVFAFVVKKRRQRLSLRNFKNQFDASQELLDIFWSFQISGQLLWVLKFLQFEGTYFGSMIGLSQGSADFS